MVEKRNHGILILGACLMRTLMEESWCYHFYLEDEGQAMVNLDHNRRLPNGVSDNIVDKGHMKSGLETEKKD